MRKLLIAAALAGTMIGGAAIAGQAEGGPGGGMMARADTNGDGMISRAEFIAQADQRFARLDANGDGQLAGDELNGRSGGPSKRLLAADANHDGVITRAEFEAQAADRFARLDTNGDGQISPDEMKAMMDRLRTARGAAGDDGAPPAPPPGANGVAFSQAATPEDAPTAGKHHHGRNLMARLDTNGDGKITREEMRAEADKRFDKLDTNHDGVIDQTEVEAVRARMMAMRGKRHHRMGDAPAAAPAPATPDTGQ